MCCVLGSELKRLEGFKLRTAEQYYKQQLHAEALSSMNEATTQRTSKQKRKRVQDDGTSTSEMTKQQYMSLLGINTFDHAYKGIYWPCVVHVPRDLMHVELEGTLKSHLIGVLYMAIRRLKWFTLGRFNKALKDWCFPQGKRPDTLPEIPKGIHMSHVYCLCSHVN